MKKGYIEMTKKLYLETFKGCARSLCFPLLITVGTIYQSNFLEVLNDKINKIDSMNNETYIFGDFNISLYLKDSYILARKIS